MTFSDRDLREMKAELGELRPKYEQLLRAYVYREYSDPIAKEHAQQGFIRRLKSSVTGNAERL
jgi:hypothetical protein